MPLLNFRYQKNNKILIAELANTKAHNAFSLEMAREIMGFVFKEKPHGIVLTHKGPYFCAGGNLKDYQALKTKEEGLQVNREICKRLDELAKYPVPKACYINGPCFGGGVELASCFDLVAASPAAVFGLWQRKVGLSFGWGGAERLQKRMNSSTLQNWLYSADLKNSYEACEMGLVDQIHLSQKGLKECVDWVKKVYAYGKESFAVTKPGFKTEESLFEELWWGPEHQSALKKF